MKKNEGVFLFGFVLFLLFLFWLFMRKGNNTIVTDTLVETKFITPSLPNIVFELQNTKTSKCNTCSTQVAEAQQEVADILKQKQNELTKHLDSLLNEVKGEYHAI